VATEPEEGGVVGGFLGGAGEGGSFGVGFGEEGAGEDLGGLDFVVGRAVDGGAEVVESATNWGELGEVGVDGDGEGGGGGFGEGGFEAVEEGVGDGGAAGVVDDDGVDFGFEFFEAAGDDAEPVGSGGGDLDALEAEVGGVFLLDEFEVVGVDGQDALLDLVAVGVEFDGAHEDFAGFDFGEWPGCGLGDEDGGHGDEDDGKGGHRDPFTGHDCWEHFTGICGACTWVGLNVGRQLAENIC